MRRRDEDDPWLVDTGYNDPLDYHDDQLARWELLAQQREEAGVGPVFPPPTREKEMTAAAEDLSATMRAALGAMPVVCVDGCLPPGSPSGATIKALERRGLIHLNGDRWERTLLGEAAWRAS